MTHDPVNSPAHYAEGRQYEPIAVIEDWELGYRLGNALKYISRAGRKQNTLEDLKKAAWYLQREIEAFDTPGPYSVEYEDALRPSGDIRVYELARELGLSNREVLEACDSLGVNVKSHSSSLCAAAASKLRGFLGGRAEYEDVLDYYGQSTENDAWPADDLTESNDGILGAAGTDGLPFAHEEWTAWDEFDAWDASIGPTEVTLTQAEVDEVLSRKALHQFAGNEIVATIEKRGLIIGVKKDGSTCELGSNGQCK